MQSRRQVQIELVAQRHVPAVALQVFVEQPTGLVVVLVEHVATEGKVAQRAPRNVVTHIVDRDVIGGQAEVVFPSRREALADIRVDAVAQRQAPVKI